MQGIIVFDYVQESKNHDRPFAFTFSISFFCMMKKDEIEKVKAMVRCGAVRWSGGRS